MYNLSFQNYYVQVTRQHYFFGIRKLKSVPNISPQQDTLSINSYFHWPAFTGEKCQRHSPPLKAPFRSSTAPQLTGYERIGDLCQGYIFHKVIFSAQGRTVPNYQFRPSPFVFNHQCCCGDLGRGVNKSVEQDS